MNACAQTRFASGSPTSSTDRPPHGSIKPRHTVRGFSFAPSRAGHLVRTPRALPKINRHPRRQSAPRLPGVKSSVVAAKLLDSPQRPPVVRLRRPLADEAKAKIKTPEPEFKQPTIIRPEPVEGEATRPLADEPGSGEKVEIGQLSGPVDLDTGSRPKELFGAKWQDFDLVSGIWSKPAQTVKQRRIHRVPLQNAALATLRRMHEEITPAPEPGHFLFPSDGRDGHLTTIKNFAKTVLKTSGVKDVRPYDLRKVFATRLVASGADLRTIMSLTGHTQVAVLIKHYAQVMDGKQKEVLDKVFG